MVLLICYENKLLIVIVVSVPWREIVLHIAVKHSVQDHPHVAGQCACHYVWATNNPVCCYVLPVTIDTCSIEQYICSYTNLENKAPPCINIWQLALNEQIAVSTRLWQSWSQHLKGMADTLHYKSVVLLYITFVAETAQHNHRSQRNCCVMHLNLLMNNFVTPPIHFPVLGCMPI